MEDYDAAVLKLIKYQKADTSNSYVNYKIGETYLKSICNKEKSLPYLKKCVSDASNKFPDGNIEQRKAPLKAWILLGDSYALNQQYDQAIFSYQRYFKVSKSKDKTLLAEVNRKIENAQNAKRITLAPIKFEKQLASEDFFTGIIVEHPVVSSDESVILFTTEETEAQPVFFSTKKSDAKWNKPEDITEQFKLEGDASPVFLSKDGKKVILTRMNNRITHLFESTFDGKKWSKATWMPAVINSKNQTGACLTSDGNTLYFVSDKPGGIGGTDIYRSTKDAAGQWNPPVNIGDKINTKYDEEHPFILDDNRTMFFASTGHSSMGGFDVFYSRMQDNGEWGTPVNLGYPFNSPDDEKFYFPLSDGFTGYTTLKTESKKDVSSRQIYRVTISPLDTSIFAQMREKKEIKSKESLKSLDTISGEKLHKIHLKDTNAFTILVKEARNAEESSYLLDMEGIKVFNKDGKYNYYFGLYYNKDTALADLGKFKQLGFNNAELKSAKDELYSSAVKAKDLNKTRPEASMISKIENAKEKNEVVEKNENTVNTTNKKSTKKEIAGADSEQKVVKKTRIQSEDNSQYDEVKVPRYTIQVCATRRPTSDYAFFKDLKKVRQNLCSDDWYRYTSGDFDDYESAAEELKHVKAAGFKGAYVISYEDYRRKFFGGKATAANVKMLNTNVSFYEIQILSATEPVTLTRRFGQLESVKEYECKDGRYRYTTGNFSNYKTAKQQLAEIHDSGFDGAFIIGIQNFEDRFFNGDMEEKTKIIENPTANKKWAIQIALTKKRKDVSSFGIDDVEEQKTNGGYKYFYGNFNSYKEAQTELKRIQNAEYPSAFIIAK